MRARFISVGTACIMFLLASVMLGGCAPSESRAGNAEAPVSDAAPAASELAALTAMDKTVPASGPAVDELISIADIKGILGRDDIVFAVAT